MPTRTSSAISMSNEALTASAEPPLGMGMNTGNFARGAMVAQKNTFAWAGAAPLPPNRRLKC